MNFQDLDIQIRYRSEIHNFPRDFLIPVLSQTKIYKRGTGYFSTTALIQLSVGLFEMVKSGGRIQIVCSPNLDKKDIEAIDYGYKNREEVIANALLRSIQEPITYFEEERLNLIATLIANGSLDIKIAFLEDDDGFRLYHEKIAVFIDYEGNRISYAGSANESENGLDGNFESVYTFCSWKDSSQLEAVCIAENDFDQMWDNETVKLHVIDFPDIVVKKLMKYKKASGVNWNIDEEEFRYRSFLKSQQKFRIPDGVSLRGYQEKAVQEWQIKEYKGIFDMCTGAGKTFTALYGMVQLAKACEEHIAVFIVCPYIHLVNQWEEDVEKWCTVPIIIAHSKSPNREWKQDLMKMYKRFRKGGSPFVCITTNDTFAGEDIQQYIVRFNDTQNVLLIVDEAHNFGSAQMIKVMPWNIANRIALSATIKRYMDKNGTNKINEFFGEKCIEYSLERAIEDGNLVHYEYIPILVALSNYELTRYRQLSQKLKRYITVKKGKMKISEAGKPIIFQRTRLLAGAENKIALLMTLFKNYKNDNNILVYCGATSVEDEDTGEILRQIDLVTKKLQTEYQMSVKRFTAEENLKERENIKTYFAQGMYQVVTAIKCLDEGVNIPGIKTAFIMSSSRNPKEFVQRRGRLLRKSDNKKKAVIYDFITLPRDLDNVVPGDIEEDKTIIVGEVARMVEFGKLADNPEVTDNLVNQMMTAYDYFFDAEEEMKKMEEYYGE
ncbi:DEAD/DEAH box helicase [Schaedlerella arabinosiphila]|uniref:DEAD/DEAH box helicase n=1 Tax=Schaedlerella arabinosiphila TaxID=2044587 RepID=A0A9X5H6Q7_9FIRM|nr:DEAD/DEAH box helicase family protein [Schaedlerella arabinosiphila]KAI4440810.1 hypothetical protein C824_003309 [Schaedlerella arabinosiphila]NDO69353.1 DEAD/DEAH box helicase [Schaedlerella arabinosiphila]